MHRVLRLLSASGAREPGGHLFLPPWGALVETEFRDSNTLTQHTQRGGLGPQSAPRGPASQAPPHLPTSQMGCHHLPTSRDSPVSFDRTSFKSKVTIRDVSGG